MSEYIHVEGESTAPETGSGGSPVDPLRDSSNWEDPLTDSGTWADAVGENGNHADPLAASSHPIDPLVGTVLDNRFEIEEVLGTGGAGVVYKAKQLRVNRHVAIKTIRMQVDNDVIRERFQREINSLCALNHPNIVTVYDCIFGYDDQPYVVMDYLKGLALDALLKRDGAMDLNKFARISLQMISALEHAHKKGIVHRDLKPGNIVLIDDDTDIVKVVDFGLAKLTHDRSLTKTGELWGSPPYMSPEQAQGEPSDTRSDIYSLGAVMYEMLTGKDPFFEVVSVYELIQAHVLTPPPRFSERNLEFPVPFAVEDTILKCLEKKPEDRFQTVGDLQSSLVEALSGQLEGASRDYLLRFATRSISGSQNETRNNSIVDNSSRGSLIITQKEPVAFPPRVNTIAEPPVPRSQPIAMNSRFQSQPGSAVNWLPWMITACSLLLACSLGFLLWQLRDRVVATGVASSPGPSTIAGEKSSAPEAISERNPASEPDKINLSPSHTVTNKSGETSISSKSSKAPALVHRHEAGIESAASHSAASTVARRKTHTHPGTAHVTTPSTTHAPQSSAKPKNKKDPWGDLIQLR